MERILNIPSTEYEENSEIRIEDFIGELKHFDWLIYSYGTGCYEGSGNMIWKKDNKFFHHDMGHCSCYGWEENISDEKGFDSLEELLKDSSDSIGKSLEPFLNLIKKEGLS